MPSVVVVDPSVKVPDAMMADLLTTTLFQKMTLENLLARIEKKPTEHLNQHEIEKLIDEKVRSAVDSATKQVFNRKEASEYLRIKLTALWGLTKRGLLHPNRATGKPLYLREDLDKFMREGQSLVAEQ